MSNADAGGAAHNAMIRVEENADTSEGLIVPPDGEAWMWVGFLGSALEDAVEGLEAVVSSGQTNMGDAYIDRGRVGLRSYQGMKAQHDQKPSEALSSPSQPLNFTATLGPLTLAVTAPEGPEGHIELFLAGHITPVHIHLDRSEAREVFRALGEAL